MSLQKRGLDDALHSKNKRCCYAEEEEEEDHAEVSGLFDQQPKPFSSKRQRSCAEEDDDEEDWTIPRTTISKIDSPLILAMIREGWDTWGSHILKNLLGPADLGVLCRVNKHLRDVVEQVLWSHRYALDFGGRPRAFPGKPASSRCLKSCPQPAAGSVATREMRRCWVVASLRSS